MFLRMKTVVLITIWVFFLIICGPYLLMGVQIALTRPGIGDVKQAQRKIKDGMSKDEVRALLGSPHREDSDEWDYWSNKFVDCILRIHFGPDGRVTDSECWAQ